MAPPLPSCEEAVSSHTSKVMPSQRPSCTLQGWLFWLKLVAWSRVIDPSPGRQHRCCLVFVSCLRLLIFYGNELTYIPMVPLSWTKTIIHHQFLIFRETSTTLAKMLQQTDHTHYLIAETILYNIVIADLNFVLYLID